MFSFGLGNDCDKVLVEGMARSGRGTSTIVRDGSDDLSGQVIRSLSNAMQHSLKDAKYGWNDEMTKAEELYRNSLVYSAKLMSKEAFEFVKFAFKAQAEKEEEPIDLTFGKADFKQV